jgi:hypothetical protein
MELAGSMGMWNLDDYQFVAVILRAAQLSQGAKVKPYANNDPEMAKMLKKGYHIPACLAYIPQVKACPFHEYSNQLWNISGVPNWPKVYSGLMKMYKAEVLCMYPSLAQSSEDGYERAMRDILEEMASWMASMAEMQCLKNVTIYNPMVPLGLLDDEKDEEHILRLWGSDPVHPTGKAYEAIAHHLRDTIETMASEQKTKNASASNSDGKQLPPPPQRAPKPIRRESCISGTEPMAKRQATASNTSWKHAPVCGQSSGRHWKRGFRGSGSRGCGGGGSGRGFSGHGGRWMRGSR